MTNFVPIQAWKVSQAVTVSQTFPNFVKQYKLSGIMADDAFDQVLMY